MKKKLDHNQTLKAPIFSFEFHKNFINRKQIAKVMTPKLSNEVNFIESTHRQQHQSRPRDRHHFDPVKIESPDYYNFFNCCWKNG